jgi:hypothetical protein
LGDCCPSLALADLTSPELEDFRNELSQLERLHGTENSPGKLLLEQSEEIWCRPGRDAIQTALARLYAALAFQQQGAWQGYQREVEAALGALSADERFTPSLLDRILQLCPVAPLPASSGAV